MPTDISQVPAERIPSSPSLFPPHWSYPGVYGIYSSDDTLNYVAASACMADDIAGHITEVKDPSQVFAVRLLSTPTVDAVPLGDIATNWVMAHTEAFGDPPVGNGDGGEEWRREPWRRMVKLRAGDDIMEEIKRVLRDNRVVLFMKGNAERPRCGFSARTLELLMDMEDGVEGVFRCVDCLDPANGAIREGIKKFGSWPTIPQLYVDGDLVGGADIVGDMYNNGELSKMLGPVKTQVVESKRNAAR